jgi:hypothetical protein
VAGVAEQILRDVYKQDIRIDTGRQPAGMRGDVASLTPSVRLDHAAFAMNFSLTANPLGVLVICQVRSGRVIYHSNGQEQAHGPGEVVSPVQPGHPHIAHCTETVFETTVIDPDLLSQIAGTVPGRTGQPVRFTSSQPLSAQAARTWATACAFVRNSVLANPDAASQPLLTASAARLLAATALATFPNNTVTEPTSDDRHDAHPATVRRAVAFIDEHAQEDITATGIVTWTPVPPATCARSASPTPTTT